MIKLSLPAIGEEEKNAVLEAIRSGQISQGPKVEELENKFKDYLGIAHAAATSSGTTALHLACLALGLRKGDEVITTPFSFIASTNAIIYTGAKPVFVDIDETFNLNADLIEKKITPKTKAILPVHLFGQPCNMPTINKLAKKYNLKIIEDACQAHGAEINGKKVGTFGDVACFSFYVTKNMTTIEGGMVVSNNLQIIERIKSLRNHGSTVRYFHKELGYNFRMSDLNAAIGIEQLKKLNNLNNLRISNALFYNNFFNDLKSITLPKTGKNTTHVFHQYTVKLPRSKNRDEIIEKLKKAGIETGVFYPIPIHKQQLYQKLFSKLTFPVAEEACERVLSLPIHPLLNAQSLKFVAQKFAEIVS